MQAWSKTNNSLVTSLVSLGSSGYHSIETANFQSRTWKTIVGIDFRNKVTIMLTTILLTY